MAGESEPHLSTGNNKRRSITKEQGALIRGYKIMGDILSKDLERAPELRKELSILIHDTSLGLSYERALRVVLLESGRNFRALVETPFVRAVEATPQCDDGEKAFISQMRELATATDNPPLGAYTEFRDWVTGRIPFMARGLQRSILDSGSITPLTPEEIIVKGVTALRTWRETNPDRWAEILRDATQARVEAARPRIFTDEVRGKIQGWFDQGLNYDTVTELLAGIGIETTAINLKSIVSEYKDLHYTLAETRKRQRQDYLKALEEVFRLSKSRRTTIRIFEYLGYTKGKIEYDMTNLRLLTQADWNSTLDVEGQEKTLQQLMLDFAGTNYSTIKEEYQAFMKYLKQKEIDMTVTEKAYRIRRYRTLRSIKSE